MRASRGEIKIEEILKMAGLDFEEEYIFPDLVSSSGHPLRFDFCILQNERPYYFIECDGLQHYEYGKFQYIDEETELLWKRDRQKEKYLFEHDYPLIRIPYEHYLNISLEDITLDSKYMKQYKIN